MWNTTTLSQARSALAATSLGNLAFFGGGQTNGKQSSNVVDIFNSTSQTWSNSTLIQARYWLASTLSTNKIFFGGGRNSSNMYSDAVDIFEILLSPSPNTPSNGTTHCRFTHTLSLCFVL
jgi:hypothetical protein